MINIYDSRNVEFKYVQPPRQVDTKYKELEAQTFIKMMGTYY